MIDVRIALESTFLHRVIPKISEKDIAELHEILDRLEYEVNHGYEDQELIQAHTAFHLKLYERTGNELLAHLIRLFATIQRTLTVFKKYRTSNKAEFVELHRRLIVALEARDPELVRIQLAEHFKDVIAWSNQHRDAHL